MKLVKLEIYEFLIDNRASDIPYSPERTNSIQIQNKNLLVKPCKIGLNKTECP